MQKKRKPGRPRKNISLRALEKLCELNCTQAELAAFFNVSVKTVEHRMAHDEPFHDAVERGREKGKLSIRREQIKMARAGNATMLIWLGKQLLGQKDKVEHAGPEGKPLELNVSATDVLLSRINALAARARPAAGDQEPEPSAG